MPKSSVDVLDIAVSYDSFAQDAGAHWERDVDPPDSGSLTPRCRATRSNRGVLRKATLTRSEVHAAERHRTAHAAVPSVSVREADEPVALVVLEQLDQRRELLAV